MKPILCVILCMAGAIIANSQDASNVATTPGITIVNFTWARKTSAFPPVRGELSPLDASQDSISSQSSSTARPGPPGNPFPPGGNLSYFYLYTIKIRNDGAKVIKAIAWEHVFNDPVSKKELARRQLTVFKNIGVNSSESLRAKLSSPPSNIVSAEALEQNNHSPYVEKVQIRCIEYGDGTFWEHPEAKGEGCDVLRGQEALNRAKQKK